MRLLKISTIIAEQIRKKELKGFLHPSKIPTGDILIVNHMDATVCVCEIIKSVSYNKATEEEKSVLKGKGYTGCLHIIGNIRPVCHIILDEQKIGVSEISDLRIATLQYKFGGYVIDSSWGDRMISEYHRTGEAMRRLIITLAVISAAAIICFLL